MAEGGKLDQRPGQLKHPAALAVARTWRTATVGRIFPASDLPSVTGVPFRSVAAPPRPLRRSQS
jgi:hypothetical protein